MLIRYFTSPIRLLLGLPPIYGISIGNRVLQIGRAIGLYRGSINFFALAKPIHFDTTKG